MVMKSVKPLPFLVAAFIAAIHAYAQITIEPRSNARVLSFDGTGDSELAGNDFESYLLDNGFNSVIGGAQIFTDVPGFFSFELLGSSAASNYINRFAIDNETVLEIGGTGAPVSFIQDDGFSGLSLPERLVIEESGRVWNNAFAFQTSGGSSNARRSIRSPRFGVFVEDPAMLTGLDQVIFAYEDASWTSQNFDGLIVRATFTPVPEPETMALLAMGLAGTDGLVCSLCKYTPVSAVQGHSL